MLYGAPLAGHVTVATEEIITMSPRGPLAHRRQHEAGEVVGAHRVVASSRLDLGGVGVGDRVAPRGDAGVGDEQVDVAEVVETRRDHRRVGLGVVDRRLVRLAPPPAASIAATVSRAGVLVAGS